MGLVIFVKKKQNNMQRTICELPLNFKGSWLNKISFKTTILIKLETVLNFFFLIFYNKFILANYTVCKIYIQEQNAIESIYKE